jgi:beta-glucosidase
MSLVSSGRIPYTVGKQISDYAAQVDYTVITLTPIQLDYSEQLNIDYRHFDSVSIGLMMPIVDVLIRY